MTRNCYLQSLGITVYELYPTYDEYALAVEDELTGLGEDLYDCDRHIVADAFDRGLSPEECVWGEILARYSQPDMLDA